MMRRNHQNPYQGSRRARSIWDETRKENAPRTALFKAILYELQPVRFCTVQPAMTHFFQSTSYFITKFLPKAIKICFQFACNRSMRQWLFLLGLVLYWQTVAYLHRLLDAGPIILIITALVIIFTVGLGDNASANADDEGYISPYSVFNRGFQSILGSIDADNLLQQHVGGGAAAAAAAMAVNDDNIGGGNRRHDGRQINRNVRRAGGDMNQGDQAQQQQQQEGEVQDENQNQNNNNNNINNNNRPRKSGKKARRKRNLEQKRAQRREIELQREAAAALGFGGGDRDDVVAMNRLIEEQAELARINNVGEFDENDDI